MISNEFAADQIDRLRGLDFFPGHNAAIYELIKALQEIALDEEHADLLISAWICDNTKAPVPANIYSLRQPVQLIAGQHGNWLHEDQGALAGAEIEQMIELQRKRGNNGLHSF